MALRDKELQDAAHPIQGRARDLDPILDMVGDRRFVLVGEASHGTHEFYQVRADLTRRLVEEKGFNAVIVEADWPDAYRVNRYVRGFEDDEDADAALSNFQRFPLWMWRNTVVREFVDWLRTHNDAKRSGSEKTGFYGMDLYSLYGSVGAVLQYLDKVDPEAATRARYRYGCFEHFAEDPQAYGYAASFDVGRRCEDEVVQQLVEIRQKSAEYARRDGRVAEDEYFYAEQNARLVRNAERYYRSMFAGRVSSWNLRDEHMAETVDALVNYLDQHVGKTRVVIWAHNSHLGDARATEMGQGGELNVGQLVRQRHPDDSVLIGFSTYTGTVTAASNWDEPAQLKRVQPGFRGSYEVLFHEVGPSDFILRMQDAEGPLLDALRTPRLQRAIGVIYRPETERLSHYFHTRLAEQFDVMIHLDATRALEPLDRVPSWTRREVPETYPTGV